jgi:hypothetical protein
MPLPRPERDPENLFAILVLLCLIAALFGGGLAHP